MVNHALKFDELATTETVAKTLPALRERGILAEFIESRDQALAKIVALIPAGASVMTGASRTLEEIGFIDLLVSGQHPWNNLKNEMLAESDPVRQMDLRRASVVCDFFLGSVHAITEGGEAVIASASGSQLPAYAFTARNVIWVAGSQKIVPDLELAFDRIKEYVFPLEDARMKSTGAAGSGINKILIFSREWSPYRKIFLELVGEKLGF